jgi:glycosyltransferase involved in cell wall biosynthesis
MKILNIIWGCAFGGATNYILSLPQMSQYADIEIKTLCINSSRWNSNLDPLHKMGADVIEIKGRHDFSWKRKCSREIDSFKPDLVFVHGFNGPVVARACQKKSRHQFDYVCSYHGPYHAPCLTRKPFEALFNRMALRNYTHHAAGILAVAEYCENFLVDKGVPNHKITTIHNGICPDVNIEPIDREEAGLSEKDFVIGVASRLDPVKGVIYLIDALPMILEQVPNAKLVIIGDGPLKEPLKKRCRNLDISDKVFFKGYQDNVNSWLGLFDVFALPSLFEYHSLGLLEAMRAGKAIVATDVGGNTESVVDRQHGLIVPSKNSAALVSAIAELASNSALRSKLENAAKKRFMKRFTLEISLKKTADWLMSFK